MNRGKLLILSLLALLIGSCSSNKLSKDYRAKYVFLFIGDGMGVQQVNIAKVYADSVLKDSAGLVFTKFPVASFSTTYAATRYITCSAAAGTALSTGSKTSIGTIGLNAKHTDTLFSIAKKFKDNGRKVAILTSVSIDHATPSAFYAHKGSRNSYYEISKDLLISKYDFFASGGFVEPNGSKKDTNAISIYQLGIEKGIAFTSTLNGVDSLKKAGKQSIVYTAHNAALSSTLQYEIDRAKTDISLRDITKKAIEVVDNPNGFFVMVEGGKIDWACHDNDAATTINEVIAFSDAIKEAIEFYKRHPKETLIIVTADHETAGMSLGNAENGYNTYLDLLRNQKVSQEKFHNLIETHKQNFPKATFSSVLELIQQQTGLTTEGKFALTTDEIATLKGAYETYFGIKNLASDKNTYSKTNILAKNSLSILNKKAGIGWTSTTHTGSPVPVFALGEGQELFSSFLDNTDIPKNILKASGN